MPLIKKCKFGRKLNMGLLISLVNVLSFFGQTDATLSQWVKLTITNQIPQDLEISVELHDFELKWGHFYECNDEKRRELPLHGQIVYGDKH